MDATVYVFDIDEATSQNRYFRRVVYTSDEMQLTLFPKQDIAKETQSGTWCRKDCHVKWRNFLS